MGEGEGSVSIGDDRSLREVAPLGVFAVGSIVLNDEVVGGKTGVGVPCEEEVAGSGVDGSREIRRRVKGLGAGIRDGLASFVGIGRDNLVVVILSGVIGGEDELGGVRAVDDLPIRRIGVRRIIPLILEGIVDALDGDGAESLSSVGEIIRVVFDREADGIISEFGLFDYRAISVDG